MPPARAAQLFRHEIDVLDAIVHQVDLSTLTISRRIAEWMSPRPTWPQRCAPKAILRWRSMMLMSRAAERHVERPGIGVAVSVSTSTSRRSASCLAAHAKALLLVDDDASRDREVTSFERRRWVP